MATLALGLGGAAVGFAFGGPLGASLGWSAGALAGGLLFGKTQHGPRLTDDRTVDSAYGQPITIGFGTKRTAGKLIWKKKRTEHKKKSSGKGGPKVVEYSYTQSHAWLLGETSFIGGGGLINNPIQGILRIWKNGDLIFGEGSDGAALPFTIYYGTEDQLPDPTMEAEEGAGNVPAHRGQALVVFDESSIILPCNLEFEVIFSGAIDLQYYAKWAVDYDYPINASTYAYPYILSGVENTADGLVLHRYRSGADYGAEMGTSDDSIVYYDRSVYDLKGALLSTDTQAMADMGAGIQDLFASLNSDICYVKWQIGINCGAGVEFFNTFAWLKAGVVTYTPPDLCAIGELNRNLPIESGPIYFNGYVFAAGKGTGTDIKLRRWPAPDGGCYTATNDPDIEFNADAVRTGYPISNCVADTGDLMVGDDGYIYWLVGYSAGVTDGTRLFKFDLDLNLIETWWTGDGSDLPTPGYGATGIWRGNIVGYYTGGVVLSGVPCYVMNRLESDGSTTFVTEVQVDGTALGAPQVSPVQYIGGGLAAVRDGILQLGSTGTTWGEIVANVSLHCGFADTEYDVSELTDQVRGYAIGNRMTGRAAIEAGMPAYQHGAVESNLLVKFPKWGGEVDATVTSDDLGARDDSSDPIDPLAITHLDDKQLPQRIEVTFLNYAMDYQEGTQYAARTASASDFNAAVSIPIVFVDSEAKAIADVLLFNAWMERDKYKFSLPRKWAHLEPTDVIDLDGHAVRITNKDESGYTHINFEGVATGTGVFITAPVAPAPIGFVPQVPPTLNRTDLLLLDIPMVTDADFNVGYSAVMAGRMEGSWPGAGLFKSIDGGVNYDSIASTVEPDTFGVATTVLADWTGGNVFDETNTVTVRLTPGSGELTSSNELGVLNGANKAMLGSEMIQFKTATLDDLSSGGSRTYTLSGLLRYRRGSDRGANPPVHALAENFSIVPAHNLEADFHELGQSRAYKAVTSGGLLASASEVDFTNTGVSLKPYAPVELGGGRDGSGNLTLNWTRRTRVGGAWLDYVDAPVSEAVETYNVIVYSNSSYATVIRQGAVTTATLNYTAALQTTDFGSPQATVYWGVQQLGSYGYGYEARSSS